MEGNLTEKDMDMIYQIVVENLGNTYLEDDQIIMLADQIKGHIEAYMEMKEAVSDG